MKHIYILLTLGLVLTSCRTLNHEPLTVTQISHDTLYINKVQYDSIYKNDSFLMDYHPSKEFIYLLDSVLVFKVDTMYVRDKSVQYKYKYLRDTTYIHKVDTIPVVKTVEVVKSEQYIPPWIKTLAWIGAIALLLIIIYPIVKLKL